MSPYVSHAQRRKFHAMLARGEISRKTVDEWDEASKGRKLPERVRLRKRGKAGDLAKAKRGM